MTLSLLFIDSSTYWQMIGSLALLALVTTSCSFSAESMLIRGLATLISLVSVLFLLGFIYYTEYNMILYESQDTIDIIRWEQPANINGAVLTARKKSDAISASSRWLEAVERQLPDLVANLKDESEKRDLKFCVEKSKQDLSNVTSIVGADGDKQIQLDNLLITCLRDKGYKLK